LAHQARAVFEPAQRMLQLAMAHRSGSDHQRAVRHGIADVVNSSAEANNGAAPTAERASRNATSYGFTTRSRVQPKLAMARAAAPMFNGFRGATSTTRSSDLSKKFAIEALSMHFSLDFFLEQPYI
jgi:hypothetical protein